MDYQVKADLLGRKVRQARKEKGLTQKQLAAQIGVSATQLYKYETAKDRLCAVRLCNISEITGKPIGWFLDAPAPCHEYVIDEYMKKLGYIRESKQKGV